MQIGGYFGAPLPHKIIDEEPSKVSEGPLATYERKPRTTKTIDLEPAGRSPKDGAPPSLQEPSEEWQKSEDYGSDKLAWREWLFN